jgi:hypothetical protein
LEHDVVRAGDRLDVEMIGQGLEALDELTSTVVAVMMLFAIINVPIVLKLGGTGTADRRLGSPWCAVDLRWRGRIFG